MSKRNSNWGRPIRHSLIRAWIVALLTIFLINSVVFAEREIDNNLDLAAKTGSSPLLISEPCELPAPAFATLSGAGLGVPLPGQGQGVESSGIAHLVITCLRFTRSHYPFGMQWQAEIVVTNRGSTTSDPFGVGGFLCRFLADGTAFQCLQYSVDLAHDEPGLEPGQSRLLMSAPHPFSLSIDPPNLYPSWVSGLPDNGTVYLRARIDSMPQDQFYVTDTIYPTAPSDASWAADFVDIDQDGWSPDAAEPDRDCDDTNPDIHPGALEVAGDGHPNDCVGGDASLGGPCDTYYGAIHGENEFCGQPGTIQNAGTQDLDSDTYSITNGDCDDTNPLINPGMIDLPDGIDNNCNGLIDETWAQTDWVIDWFLVQRDFQATDPASLIQLPGVRYEIEIDNLGDDIGDDFSMLAPAVRFAPWGGIAVASGFEGFVPYTQIPGGRDLACSTSIMIAKVNETGIFGETNFSNNYANFQLPHLGTADLEVGFYQHPNLDYEHGSNQLILHTNIETVGTCPPLPRTASGGDYLETKRKVIVSNKGTYLQSSNSAGLTGTYTIFLSEPLQNHDIVCAEVRLDPDHLIAENHNNNMSVQVLEYKKPLIGAGHFDTYIPAYMGGFGAIAYPQNVCNLSAVNGALIGGGPTLGGALIGAILVGVVGGIAGGVGGRIARWGRNGRLLLVGGGLLLGVAAGAAIGDVAANSPGQTRPGVGQVIDVRSSATDSIPSCDIFLDPTASSPEDGTVFFDQPQRLELSIAIDPAAPAPAPSSYTLRITSPTGREATFKSLAASDEHGLSLDVSGELAILGSTLLDEDGVYRWSVASGELDLGGDLNPIQMACAGSSEHTFMIERRPTGTPTPTSTTAPILPPTSTPEPPPEPTKIPPKLTPTPAKKATKPSG